MANTYSAELLISTTKANKEMQAMNGQVQALDKSLANLGKTLAANQSNLDQTVKSIGAIVTASREASKASEEAAKAKLAEAKAQAEVSKGNNARNIAEATVAQKNSVVAVNQSTVAYKQARTEAVEFANSQRQVKSSTDEMGNSLANQRYLLYDVGATYRTLGLAAAALPTASIAAATAYEKSFAQVIRVSGETSTTAATLRDEIKALGTEIPLSFAELSNIAQIGGQMNIATEGLAGFTETVAKFVATADGATIESSTQAFGRLANLFANDLTGEEQAQFFERIGSAISYTADNAVTSEAKIVSMLEKISPIGAQAGMAAEEVVAFASALSSVGLQPEISSGFLTRFFGNLNKDVAAGGDSLNAYNKILGTTSGEFVDLYKNDPTEVVRRLVEAMSGMDKIAQTSALGELGIKATRDQRVIQALAGNYHVLEDALRDTNEAFNEGTYLDQSSQGIFNTFSANLTKLANSLTNLGDTVGSGTLPILNQLVGALQFLVDGANELIGTSPAVKTFVTTLIGLGSVLGVIFALRSASAFLTAGLVTLTHVTRQAQGGGLTLTAQLGNLSRAMIVNKGVSDQTASSLVRQMGAVKALGAAQSMTAVQLRALNVQMLSGGTASKGFVGGIKGAGGALLGLAGGPIGLAVGALVALGGAWIGSAMDAKAAAADMARAAQLGGDALTEVLGREFGEDKIGFFEANNIQLVGKTYGELADSVGLSMSSISASLSEGSEATSELIERLESEKQHLLDTEGQSLRTTTYTMLIEKLQEYVKGLETSESGASRAEEAQDGLTRSGKDLVTQYDENGNAITEATEDLTNWTSELNNAIEAAFGLTNAQAGLEASLEKLGAGLSKDNSVGLGSEGGRANLESFQSVLAQQAAVLQQSIKAGEISAQQAGQSFQQYAMGLIDQLNAMGVDTSGLMADVDNAIGAVQGTFAEQPATLSVDVDTNGAIDSATSALAWLGDFLDSNPQLATIGLTGENEVSDKVYNLISYISEATGMPFEAVVQAITTPAGEDTEHVVKFMEQAVGQDFMAYINADTSAGVANVQNFAIYAGNQLAEIAAQSALVAANIGGPAGAAIGAAFGQMRMSVLAAPAQTIAKANKAAAPSFTPLKRGYDDAAKAARNAGNSAGGAGKKAKKANDDTAKGSKKATEAVKEQAKEWDELESQISGYASRVGTAFGYVTARQTGVAEAKDEYYSILNGIKERLESQKQTVRDLRQENKLLNAERRVQLNDAAKLEKMAGYADQVGNTERAKYYRDEAKALKESAKESGNKVSANEKEAKAIEKGIGNLKGYTKEAIDNRKELRSLRDASLKVSEAYAASGASAKTVESETRKWTATAKKHGTQLGYSKKDVEGVTGKTNSYVTALKKVPKTIATKVTASNSTASGVNAAKKNLNSIPSRKTSTITAKGAGISAVERNLNTASKNRSSTITAKFDSATKKRFRTLSAVYSATGNFGLGSIFSALSAMNRGGLVGRDGMMKFNRGGLVPGTPPSDPKRDNIMASLDGNSMAMIRSGEYVQSQPAVDYYGSDIMDKLNRQEIPRYALGGQLGNRQSGGGNTPSVIDLSAESIQSVARLVQKDVFLYVDNQLLAQSVHKGNEIIAQRGGTF